jgi:tetratricopeptide (TPR) repeat protein
MKCISLLSFLLIGLVIAVQAQDINAMTREADRLEAIPNEKAAFTQFREVVRFQPANMYALTKCSELCSRIGNREKDLKSRDRYYAAAVDYAKVALKVAPTNDEANVVMAIAVGRTVLVKSGKEKISAVKDIKHYADVALKTNPQNFKAWHVIGKWNYEVSNLNMVERAATKVFYGGLPEASIKASIAAYEKAKNINPYFMLNYLELAKAYKRNDEKQKAVAQLKVLVTLPIKTEDDPRIKAEALKLIKSWE